MMEFTHQEIADLKDFRSVKSNPKAASVNSRGNSVSSSGGGVGASSTDPNEEEIKRKTGKGLFGMFRKGGSKTRADG
jgi:hypothetical protein